MKSKLLKWGLPGLMACTVLGAAAQQINPLTEAVLRNYGEILAENPKDYMTLYDRASQYFDMGEYVRALSDIDMALEYTPEKDKDYRIAEYSLKGDILIAQKNYDEAVKAIKAALELNPVSQPDLYKLGNTYLLVNNPSEALTAFERLQRENSRSQEAFYGMAKANAMMGKTEEADKLIKEIELLGKQSFVTYCRMADLYADMGDVKNATTNYAIAYSMEDSNSRPVESLKFLAKKNPEEVLGVLDGIIQSKPDNLALFYLKAIVAYDAGLYSQAEKACADLAANLEEESPAVYRMQALSQLAQNRQTDAERSIAKAEQLAPGTPGVLLDKAEILMGSNPQAAYEAAKAAAAQMGDDETAIMIAANAAVMAGKYDDALTYLNEVVLSNPGNSQALLLRGYVNTEYKDDGKAGVADYTRAGNIQQDGSVERLVYGALGKAKVNKRLDADGMINEAINKAGNNKDDLYLIAVYFAQTGNLEKAKEFTDRAMLNGYGNLYNLQNNAQPLFNLTPIHHLTK